MISIIDVDIYQWCKSYRKTSLCYSRTSRFIGYIDLRYRSRCNRHNNNEGARTNVPSRETGNIWYTKEKNNTNTYVLDTTIYTQTQIWQISPLTNNWRKRRTEHHLYAEIVTDITTRTTEYINKVTQITRSEMFCSLSFDMARFDFMFLIFHHRVSMFSVSVATSENVSL